MFTQEEAKFLLDVYEKNTASIALSDEFTCDIGRFVDIYKSLKLYRRKKKIGLRQVLNQFIILENVFGSVAIGFLIRKCPDELRQVLYAVLEYSGRLPNHLRDQVDHVVLMEIKHL